MRLQEFIHSLEQGRLAKWIIFLVIVILIVLGEAWFVIWHFQGLSEAKGMEQAQIAREIASGHGFTTKSITPLAYAVFKKKEQFPLDRTPDIYYAPLNPLLNAVFLPLAKKSGVPPEKAWLMSPKDSVYLPDRVIATISVFLLALGIGVNYMTAQRVFDEKIAGLSTGLMLICNQYWMFAVTGLPQLLMFFIFSCCAYVLFRAIEARRQEKSTIWWLAGAGFLFGLLALTHALTIWIFAGMLVFSLFYFVPRGQGVAIMVGIFLLVYSPWLVRNYKVCGNPFGLGYYSAIGSMDGSESDRMRVQDTSLGGLSLGALRGQMKEEVVSQTGQFYLLLGQNPMAPVFFLTLLYIFKRKEASDWLWCTFCMFLFAFVGMCVVGITNANNLYLLFTPILTLYGFAYVMMLWSRLEINIPLLRYIFIFLIYVISSLPLVSNISTPEGFSVHWPPYVPPWISVLNTWTHENEVIASDMPWAVAWYADRKSLLIPPTMNEFLNFHDWTEFNGNLTGLYLTPITGNRPLVSQILKGEDKDWAPLVLRGVRFTKDFPFHAATAMPVDNECVFYCESDRWSQKTD